MGMGEGMMAVVRALPDAGLALTLMEGGRQYTLLPNADAQNPNQPLAAFVQMNPAPAVQTASTEISPDMKLQQNTCHSSTQAVDGNYASVYKTIDNVVDMAAKLLEIIKTKYCSTAVVTILQDLFYTLLQNHVLQIVFISVESFLSTLRNQYKYWIRVAHCKLKPTSPPYELTEFPPQRAELCKGQGNFEVGGLGSGEVSHTPTKANGSYRGGMCWPDRGSVCTPRTSPSPDPFAASLRRYPALSPQRSAEIIDRLVAHTQNRSHYSPVKSRSPVSPGRSAPIAGQFRGSAAGPGRSLRAYEPDLNKPKILDESPTKDTGRKVDYECGDFKKSPFGRSYDVRYVRERRTKDNARTIPSFPCNPIVCPAVKEKCCYSPPKFLNATDSIHKETQAEIQMISKEVATVPRVPPSTRNVGVSLCLSSSHVNPTRSHHHRKLQPKCSCKSIQTSKPVDFSLQTCISSIDVNRENNKDFANCRKAKSEEELSVNDDLEQELIQLIKDLNTAPDCNAENIRNELLRKIKKINCTSGNDKRKIKFGKCIKDQLYSQMDFKGFAKELSNELITKIRENNVVVGNFGTNNDGKQSCREDNCIAELIKDWLADIPIKPIDYLGRHVNKDYVLETVAIKIKTLIMNKVNHDCYNSLKPELFDILEDIPIEVNASNKMYYLSRVVDDLVKKIEDICSVNVKGRKQWKRAVKNGLRKDFFVFKHAQPTENEMKQFVRQEMRDFLARFHLKICPTTEAQIEAELIDILFDSIEDIIRGNDELVKEEISFLLLDFIAISEHEGLYFANRLISCLKNMLPEPNFCNVQENFVVLQTLQNSSRQSQNQTADFSIEGVTDLDLLKNLDYYTKQVVKQIDEWMNDIQGMQWIDADFKKIVVQDLADDVVDRHKYLELNPSSRGTDADELEHLKYQIYKWVNKLVGEDNVESIAQAPALMERIQSIPVPMLTRPVHNIDTSRPPNTDKNSTNANLKGCLKDRCKKPKCKSPSKNALGNLDDTKGTDISPDASVSGSACQSKSDRPMKSDVTTNSCESPKKVAFTETEMCQIPKTRPRGTSMSVSEDSRRCRGSSGLPSGTEGSIYSGGSPISLNITDYGKEPPPTPPVAQSCCKNKGPVSTSPQSGNNRKEPTPTTPSSQSCCKSKGTTRPTSPQFGNSCKEPTPTTPSSQSYCKSKGTTRPTSPQFGNSCKEATPTTSTRQKPKCSGTATSPQISCNQNESVSMAQTSCSRKEPTPTNSFKQSCCQKKLTPSTSIKQLSDEYDQYLHNWVQKIPIITCVPQEQALIEKMRVGIYNGIWKALTKLHMNPTTLDNPFYYQDVLDDEIEMLLDLLPQSQQLTNQKQALKSQLIEKTVNMNKQIFDTTASSSYKQQLIDNVSNNMPRKALGLDCSDVAKTCEEILKLNLAEDYIMAVMYRDLDQVKANVYRKKLINHMQEFLDTMRSVHGLQSHEIPIKNYKDEILQALAKVPLPSDETIREEGDEILVGLEIEQWFSDLPLFPAENRLEMLCRKRYIDTLAKKVHEIEMQSDLCNNEYELRHEIRRFMGKLPLRCGETHNVPFMVEELVNRLKNRQKDVISGSRKVLFMDPNDYNEFSRDMPACSSFSDASDAKPAQINESSYMIVGGERVNNPPCGVQYVGRSIQVPESEIEWLTLLPDSDQQSPKQTDKQGLPPELQNARELGCQMMAPQTSNQVSSGQVPNQKANAQDSCSQTCSSAKKVNEASFKLPPQDFSCRQHDTGGMPMHTSKPDGLDFSCRSQPMGESVRRMPSDRPEQSIHASRPGAHDCSSRQPMMDSVNRIPSLRTEQSTNISRPGSRDSSCNNRQYGVDSMRRTPSPRGEQTMHSCRHPQDFRHPMESSARMMSGVRQDQTMHASRPESRNPSCSHQCMSGKEKTSLRAAHEHTYRQSPNQSMHGSRPVDQDISCRQPIPESGRRTPTSRPEQSMNVRSHPHTSGVFVERPVQTEPGSFTCQNYPMNDFQGVQGSQEGRPLSPRRPGTSVHGPDVFVRTFEEYHRPTSVRPCDKTYTCSPNDFFSQPVGYSTPENNYVPRQSRPKKRKRREINKSDKDAARKKLSLSDSDESVNGEVRCRCMERVWRCRKKSSLCRLCEDYGMDFPPCFPAMSMRCPPYPPYYF